jgi:hypothetical protein
MTLPLVLLQQKYYHFTCRSARGDAESGPDDLFMSLIHTGELNGANSFDYLTDLQWHAAELKGNPAEWMPWNYRETMARLATPGA